MADARSPCRYFKSRVLHFRLKTTPLKDKKMERESSKKMLSFLFVEEGKLFIKKSSFQEFNLVFFITDLWSVFNATKAVRFLLNFQVHFALYGQDNYVFEREFMYF